MSNYLEVFGLCGWESDDATEDKVSTEGTEDNAECVLKHINLNYQRNIHLEIASILLGGQIYVSECKNSGILAWEIT